MLRATSIRRAREGEGAAPPAIGTAVLAHDERHLRRKTIALSDGRRVLVDLPQAVVLEEGDALLLEDGAAVRIAAAPEALYEVAGRDPGHLVELAWHIGNRHLPAALAADRILILQDHVIRAMLEGLGAGVREVTAPFAPARGAYGGHHGHDHGHGHGESAGEGAPGQGHSHGAGHALHAHAPHAHADREHAHHHHAAPEGRP